MTPSPHNLLFVCFGCARILDGASVEERWITMECFQETSGINPIDCLITRTYCPDCHAQFIKRIKAA